MLWKHKHCNTKEQCPCFSGTKTKLLTIQLSQDHSAVCFTDCFSAATFLWYCGCYKITFSATMKGTQCIAVSLFCMQLTLEQNSFFHSRATFLLSAFREGFSADTKLHGTFLELNLIESERLYQQLPQQVLKCCFYKQVFIAL